MAARRHGRLWTLIALGAIAGCGGRALATKSGADAGSSGVGGTSGSAGATGSAGASGDAGVSGSAGASGDAGVSGSAGASGGAGVSGSAGASGGAGVSGSAGSSGVAGVSGGAGASGSAGSSGVGGTTGVAGTNGSAGTGATTECTPGDKRCVDLAPWTCNDLGAWVVSPPCAGDAPFCAAGVCGTAPPSCAPGGPGLDDCGPDHESCCTTLPIAGGSFYRGYVNDGTGPKGEGDLATLSPFKLDKYLVTVGRFRQFVAAWEQGWTPRPGSGRHVHVNGGLGLADVSRPGAHEPGWVLADDANIAPTDGNLVYSATWTPTPTGAESFPMDQVAWFEAYAFCIWDGGFLPSEAEWEYAAAGGDEQREYPWGVADPDAQHVTNATAGLQPVGTATAGAGRWGQLDLAGELYEWTLDWCLEDDSNGVVSCTTYVDPCLDCARTTVTRPSYKITRANPGNADPSWFRPPLARDFASPWRDEPIGSGPHAVANQLGFRCARAP